MSNCLKRNTLVFALFLALLFFACNSKNHHKAEKGSSTPTSSIEKPSLSNIVDIKDVAHSTLPFVDSMVHEKTQTLPQIDSAIYLKLNTSFDFNFKDGDKLQYLRSFNNQLPQLANYEVYYTVINCPEVQDSVLIGICNNFVNVQCSFLIFYDAAKKYAQIINIKNSYYIDAVIDMNFLVDEQYKIHLFETGMTDGDVGPEEAIVGETYYLTKHLIEVDVNGVIKIEELE